MKNIDVRGLSCPQPVLAVKKAIKTGEAEYEVLTDSQASKENITRFACSMGFDINIREENGEYTLELKK